MSVVIADLNPVLRGWGAYFPNGNFRANSTALDADVHGRAAILASRKHGPKGRHWTTRFT